MNRRVKAEAKSDVGPPRGRPRSPEAKTAILRAARALLAEGGPAAVTMEGVAARAGVGKPTVYRWWPDRHAVAMAALMEGEAEDVPGRARTSAIRRASASVADDRRALLDPHGAPRHHHDRRVGHGDRAVEGLPQSLRAGSPDGGAGIARTGDPRRGGPTRVGRRGGARSAVRAPVLPAADRPRAARRAVHGPGARACAPGPRPARGRSSRRPRSPR